MQRLAALLLLAAPAAASFAQGADGADLLRRAEALYARGSFEEAHKLYLQADGLKLEGGAARFVDFRVADTRWRSAAGSRNPDTSRLDAARDELQALIASYQGEAERDELWALVNESLGDFYWGREGSQDWGSGWQHYTQALDWWAGSRKLEQARGRYLGIVRRALEPAWWGARGWDDYGYRVDLRILQQAASIAVEPDDKGRTGFFLGRAYYQQGGSAEQQALARKTLEDVLLLGRANPWYDDALYQIGVFLEERGELVYRDDGGQEWRQDYVGAVARYRQLVTEYQKGETRYYDQAVDRIKRITAPEVAVGVDRFFVPGSVVQFRLRWRNVEEVELFLYPVDLTRDLATGDHDPSSFVQRLRPGAAPAARWSHATGDEGDHRPGEKELTLKDKPAAGAYLLIARGGGEESRDLVLVSDALLSAKAVGGKVLGWFTDLQTGRPIAEARVRLWERWHDGSWHSRSEQGVTGADGTVLFERAGRPGNNEFYLAAVTGARQAFVTGGAYWPYEQGGNWQVYAFADRPAYRPADTVQWKVLARRKGPEGYATPAEAALRYRIVDPRGQEAHAGDLSLNAFGAAWGTFTTTADHALGVYQIQLTEQDGSHVAGAQLFRLEEYKLPEYEVSVALPDDPARPGGKRLYRLGDRVEAVVQADYYFGGPVAGAQVEVLVYQRPYYHSWPLPHEYPWYYSEGLVQRGWWGGPGQLVSRETYTSDAEGRVRVPLETTAGSPHDLEYTLEAHVVDASRREVVAQETLRVTRQAYFVRVAPAHALHRPGDRVELELEAQDANRNPVATSGEVVVTRDRWVEIWRSPQGEELRGSALDALRERHQVFPPPAEPGWILSFNGYEREEVARGRVALGADGKGEWTFHAQREGYYTATWTSEDDRRQRVSASCAFWVAEESTRELGYRQAGVEILVDKDTFRTGERAAVMLAVPSTDRWVLFTVEGDELHHFEVVHVTGTVKLLALEIGDEHVPNVYLGALMVGDRQAWWDQEEVVVPPVKHFLDVSLAPDRAAYEPGETGTVTVTVKDHEGRPVQGEIALAVYDASLGYIQQDLAGDPRQAFYGERDPQLVHTSTTLNHRRFGKLVEKEGDVVDEEVGWNDNRKKREGERYRADFDGLDQSDSFALGKSVGAGAGGPSESRLAMNAPVAQEMAAGIAGDYRGAGDTVPPDLGAVQVRTDFRDTAVWVASVVADGDGRAVVEVPYPDSTTRWTAVARVADTGARFGIGQAETRTRQPLIARLQAPRFLQVGDEVTLSGNLNNNTELALVVHALLEVEGVELLGRREGKELADPATGPLTVPANGQTRVDWLVRVTRPGEAVLRLKAASPEHSDGMEKKLAMHAHGIDALVSRSGKLTAEELRLTLDLPGARAAGSTKLAVELTPSLAVTMLDALPYLVDYPYGCTEQTLSRFLPAAVVAGTLREFGLSAEDAMTRVFGGVEREHADKTHRKSAGLARLDDAVAQGLARLYDFQRADGGWSWWKEGESDHWMTAYVVWGLTLAQEAGVAVRADVLARGRRFLELELVERELDVDVQAWMLFALARRLAHEEDKSAEATSAFANLWEKRAGLNAYTRALFALAAKDLGRAEEARTLVENLANGVIRDERPDASVVMVGKQETRDDALKTAHWGEDGVWYRWSEGGVEATAFALRALVAIQPDHELVQPALNWLLQNRRAAQWSNTRDTAIALLALTEYLKGSQELASDVAYELFVNGESVAQARLSKDELLAAPSRYLIDPALLRDGPNEVRVVRKQGGPLYFAAHASFFSQEEPIPSRGAQVFVRREYYRLKAVPTLLKGVIYEKERLADGAVVSSGDRIEVLLTAETKNHLEYLVFEDLKPAGFEAVQVQSGAYMVARELKASEVERRFVEGGRREEVLIPGSGAAPWSWRNEEGYTGRTQSLHQELRDRHVAFFADRLPQGVWEMRYELRAETPGKFHALPTMAHAMYVPEIRGNSDELRVEVVDEGVL